MWWAPPMTLVDTFSVRILIHSQYSVHLIFQKTSEWETLFVDLLIPLTVYFVCIYTRFAMRDFLHFADIILCFLGCCCCCCCFSLSLCEQHRGISQSNKSCAIEYDGDDDGHDDSVHNFFFLFSVYCVYILNRDICRVGGSRGDSGW